MQTNECWQRTAELIRNGAENEAVKICLNQPCSSIQECQQFLGWHYIDSYAYDEAVRWFKPLAEKGDALGLYGLATAYFCMKNYEYAFDLFLNALRQGNVRSYYWLGYMFQHGLGAEKNMAEARTYYKKSANSGYLIAERALLGLDVIEEKFLKKTVARLKLPFLLFKGFRIALKNEDDERLVEVPNPFGKWGK